MKNPVLAPSGNYYEKDAILDWIERNGTDPLIRDLYLLICLLKIMILKMLLLNIGKNIIYNYFDLYI
jgi:hypothetical protein